MRVLPFPWMGRLRFANIETFSPGSKGFPRAKGVSSRALSRPPGKWFVAGGGCQPLTGRGAGPVTSPYSTLTLASSSRNCGFLSRACHKAWPKTLPARRRRSNGPRPRCDPNHSRPRASSPARCSAPVRPAATASTVAQVERPLGYASELSIGTAQIMRLSAFAGRGRLKCVLRLRRRSAPGPCRPSGQRVQRRQVGRGSTTAPARLETEPCSGSFGATASHLLRRVAACRATKKSNSALPSSLLTAAPEH